MLYSYVPYHNDTIINRRVINDAGRLFKQNIYPSLYCKGSKRFTCERELEIELELELSTSVLTELYNSLTSTRSPTRSLKSHVRSSSTGNNCHAVHRSLSSGASVYECIMGFILSYFISQFPPTRFPLITAIRMCHFLPVHHLGWHFWPGRRSKYNTSWVIYCQSYSPRRTVVVLFNP